MFPRGYLPSWAATVLVILTVQPATAGQPPTPVISFEEFIGGTGGSAAKLVRGALEQSGRFTIAGTGQWQVRASSSAGRIDGALIGPKGTVTLSNHYDSADLRDNAYSFADDIVETITGEPGIARSRIAFVSDTTGFKEIHICDSDGGRVQQITRDRSLNVGPTLGPGGILMAHTSYTSGFPDVYVTNLYDGDRQRVISAPGTNSGAAFSHDGTRLALTMTHEGDAEIFVTTVTGGRSKRLTESRSVEFSPAWAPDGERLVFCSDATGSPQLYIVPRRGGAPERLATATARCTDPDWSADGRFIAFTAWKGNSPAVALYEMETGTVRTVLGGASDPCWAPDARHLVAVQSGNLVVLNVLTGSKKAIVSGMGKISEPAWSR